MRVDHKKLRQLLKLLEEKHHTAHTSKSVNVRVKTEELADIIDFLTQLEDR